MEQIQQDLIGKRGEYMQQIGTIRYEGQLKHSHVQKNENTIWLGIEWDNKNQGKHNGTIQGVHYFDCINKEGQNGSLVKKVQVNLGHSILKAILIKYFKTIPKYISEQIDNDEKLLIQNLNQYIQELCLKYKEQQQNGKKISVEVDEEAYVETLKKHKKNVEFYGFDQIWTKISNLQTIQEMCLNNCNISNLGKPSVMSQIFKNIKTLSLENNLLYSWDQVYMMGFECPTLEELQLSGNRLKVEQNSYEQNHVKIDNNIINIDINSIFKNLNTLVLNSMELNWQIFSMILAPFHSVSTFIMVNNQLSDHHNLESIPIKHLENIKQIILENNSIHSFSKISHLGLLPNLQKLVLNNNFLDQIGIINPSHFSNLKQLSLEYNKIIDSKTLSEISQFKCLIELRIGHNPIGDILTNSYVRQRCVAENPCLKVINGSDLKKYERKDCEIYYLKKTFDDFFKVTGVNHYQYDYQLFLKFAQESYARIPELIQIYGNPYEILNDVVQLPKQNLKVLHVKIMFGQFLGKTIKAQKFPVTTTLGALKVFFQKLYKINKEEMKIQFKDNDNTQYILEEMDDDNKTLDEYFANDWAHIVIDQLKQ